MKNNTHGTTWRNAKVFLAGAVATVTLSSGNAALATGDKVFAISGNSTFSDCGAAGSDLALLMTGALKGCLSIFVQGFTCKELQRLRPLHGARSGGFCRHVARQEWQIRHGLHR